MKNIAAPIKRDLRQATGYILSIFVAYAIVKIPSYASGILESLSFLSFSFPGIVIGVGFKPVEEAG